MSKQHKVIAYLKVKVEFTVDTDLSADDVLNEVACDVFDPQGRDIYKEITEYEIFSDELVRG